MVRTNIRHGLRLLAAAALVSAVLVPGSASAVSVDSRPTGAQIDCYAWEGWEITRADRNTEVHSDPYDASDEVNLLPPTTSVHTVEYCINEYGNVWYAIDVPAPWGWVWSGDLAGCCSAASRP